MRGPGTATNRTRSTLLALAASFALALTLAPAALATAYSPIGEFGGSGTGNGLFSTTARRLAVDSSTGYVFAADAGNNRVQVFKPTACAPKCAEFLLKFPSPSPLGLAVDSSTGDVYTTHPAVNEKQIVELSAASSLGGTYKLSFGGQATGWTGSGTLNATTTVSGVSTTTGNLSKGEEISGTGIQAGTTISDFTATTITLSKAATGSGTVSLGSDLGAAASAMAMKEALEKLPAIGTNNVAVSGCTGTTTKACAVEFKGPLAATDVAQMGVDGSGLTPAGATAIVTTNVDGAVAGITKYNPVPSHANPTSYAKDPSFTSPAQGSGAGQVGAFSTTAEVTGPAAGGIAVDPTTHDILLGDLGASEVQALTVSAAAGQFRLKIGGQATGWTGSGTLNATTTVSGVSTTTGNLSKGEEISGTGIQAGTTISNFTATTITLSKAATGSGTVSLGSDLLFSASSTFVKEALEKLPAIGTGNVTVSGGPGNAAGSAPYVLSFQGSLAKTDVEQIAIENGATPLSGGTGTTSSTTTSGGVASQVKRFTSAGAFLSAFNGSSSGSAFKEVQDLAVNGQGEVVVADRVAVESTRIVHLDANGANATILGPVPNITGSGSRIVVAADPTSNDVFVSSRAEFLSALKVYRFDAGDAFVESPELTGTAGANTFGLASSGGASPRLYALALGGGGEPVVHVLGESLAPPTVAIDPVDSAGVTSAGATFSGSVNPTGSPLATCRFEVVALSDPNGFASSGVKTFPCSPSPGEGEAPVAVHATAGGLVFDTDYRVRLFVAKPGASGVSAEAAVFHTDPIPVSIVGGVAMSVNEDSAILSAQVNPNNRATAYHFQYVDQAGFLASGYAGATSTSTANAGSGRAYVGVTATIESLKPDTTYHFRLVADNGVEAAPGSTTVVGPDTTFATYPPIVFPQRGYELVSAFDTNGYGVFGPDTASADGDHFAYTTELPAPGTESGQLGLFRATRHSDGSWTQQNMGTPAAPSGSQTLGQLEPLYSGEDLSSAVFRSRSNFLDPDDQNHVPAVEGSGYDIFLKRAGQNGVSWLSRNPATPVGTPQTNPDRAQNDYYISPDGKRVIFGSERELLPADVSTGSGGGASALYEWDEGRLSLISVKPGFSTGFSGLAGLGSYTADAGHRLLLVSRNAVSRDGSRVVFQAGESTGVVATAPHLYVRIDGESTVEASASAAGVTPKVTAPSDVNYWGADENDESVYFTSTSRLTVDSSAVNAAGFYVAADRADLYRYVVPADGDPGEGKLVDLTPISGGADVRQVLNVSDDGHRVYFTANGILAPGASVGNCSSDGLGSCNIYLAELEDPEDPVKITYIASTHLVYGAYGDERVRNVVANPDGSVLAFLSRQALVPGRQTGGVQQVYAYDAVHGELSCASCPLDGSVPSSFATLTPSIEGLVPFASETEPTSLPTDPNTVQTSHTRPPVRNVTTGGAVFFQTATPLLPGDSNGRPDIFEYQGGRLDRITSGVAPSQVFFGDASADGSTVFFSIRDSLVPGVPADTFRVYAARVGGGYTPPPPTAPCTGEDCKPVATPQPNYPAPATSTIAGAGNVVEGRPAKACRKGTVRRKGHCVPKHKGHAKRAKHSQGRTVR